MSNTVYIPPSEAALWGLFIAGGKTVKKTLLYALCAVVLSTATATAAPSVSGPTGMINTPSADALREGQFSLGYHRMNEEKIGTFGISLMPNLEVGVAHHDFDNGGADNLFNAKWSVLPETVVTPGIAVGVEDIGNKHDRTAYAVASKALPLGFRIHAGVGNGRYDGMFGAIEKTINPLSILTGDNAFPATTLIAEYDGHNMNYGARMSIIPGLKLEAGWRDSKSYVGATYTY